MSNNIRYFCPADAPEVVLEYVIYGYEVDIVDCQINGDFISETTYDLLVGENRRYWEEEIVKAIERQAETYREDELINSYEIKKLRSGYES
jgi:hypothetical protein